MTAFFERAKKAVRKRIASQSRNYFALWQKQQKAKCGVLSMASNQAETRRLMLRS